MSLDTIADLRCLMMIDGTLFGNVKDASSLRPMEVRHGDALAPFKTCDQDPASRFPARTVRPLDTADLVRRSTSIPSEKTPGDVYACWINHLPDWTLRGAQTIQLMINRHDTPCEVFLNVPILIEQPDGALFFEAYLGAHRADATLNVTLRDPVTGQQEQMRFAFDTAFPGGTNRGGYAHIRHPLPAHFDRYEVDLSIEYKGHLPDEKGVEPFLFIADAGVVSAREDSAPPTLLQPEWLYGDAADMNGQWIQAPLPAALSPGQGISIKLGRQTLPLLPMRRPEFHVRENYGHTLVCSSAREMDLVLCIDGQHVEQVRINRDDTIVRLPHRYLTGHVRHLSLKDKSGCITLFEQHQLMPAIITPADVMQRESAAPFPTALLAQTPLRYAGLKATLANAGPTTNFAQLTHALHTVEGGPDNVTLAPLEFPKVAKPDVSIIIPAHNKVNLTYLALCSLLLAHNHASFEVIVVDDGSTDETTTLETLIKGITVLHTKTPMRFVRACNAGAEQAKGKYIALLNNDVEVTTGWLDELIAGFDRFDNVGLVGSKLLYPDGDLQDAGGIVWGSGNPWNYGNRQNPNDPRFCYARQADYLCGAALMLPTQLWRDLGGLSTTMEPMYFEDTDLAFRVREAGFTTWFIPSSVVYHFEGMTSGTDVTAGFKKYQEINRPKFKRRWSGAFANHGPEGRNPDLEKDRGIVGRVLFIDYAPPRADKDAGSYAALQEMRLVQSLGYKVTFVSTNMAHLGRYTEELQKSGIEVIYAPFYMNVTEYLDKHATDFDAFYITRYYVAQAVLQQIRAQAPEARVLFNNADLHFLRELRAAKSEADAGKLERARQTRKEELEVIRAADVVLSYTDVEHSVIHAYTDGQAKVVKCPWVVEVPETIPGARSRSGLSFLGSYRHHPNAEGITWFARTVMPQLTASGQEIPLTIYGSGMGEDIKALKSDLIRPHGFVADAADAFDTHRVFVAPLLSGAGIKGKVLSALARGVPCVISPIAAEGIGLRSGHDCMIADNPKDWVDAIAALNDDDDLWLEMSQNARAYMRSAYSFERGRAAMRHAFEAADLFGSRP